jgi:hypothetical protein
MVIKNNIMQTNQKYVTAENILARLATKVKNKNYSIEEIVQWCAECTIEIVGNPLSMYTYNKVKLYVEKNKALLPCNLYRLYDVYDVNEYRHRDYFNDGTHLIFPFPYSFQTDESNRQFVYVNYKGIAVDPKTGWPLILRGHELACEAYCIKQLYREDYYSGKIPQHVWADISFEASNQCAAANNGFRHETNDDMRQIMLMVHNMIPRMSELPMLHLDGIE